MRVRAVAAFLVVSCVAVMLVVIPSGRPAQAGAPDRAMTIAHQYLRAVLGGSTKPTVLARALKYAEPGSDAMAYVEFQTDNAVAIRDAGRLAVGATERRTFRQHGTSIIACRVDRHDCATYGNFRLGSTRRLRTFSVNGKPLPTRIVADPNRSAEALGARFQFLVAYQTAADNLVVVGDLRVDDRAPTIDLLHASYVDPAGRQVTMDNELSSVFAVDLAPGARAIVALTFPATAIGGHLRIPVDDPAAPQTPAILDLLIARTAAT